MNNIDSIKKHFEEEAQQYDSIIQNLIPYYNQMVEAVANTIPFEKSYKMEVLDLGCGTGTISKTIKSSFANAKFTCIDISEKMLKIAENKLSDVQDAEFINVNFYDFDFDKKYDAVVSSLALHHLETNEDKHNFYKKIYEGLNKNGIFINADVVLASNDTLQESFMKKWYNFMCANVSENEVRNKWIPTYYKEDRPISLMSHFEMLKDVGFTDVDVVWKYYNFAVFTALK